ncbi:MAG: hypothetical protein GY793_08280, partial [Proteobacteria bacterium]|nr:hypothetical protein [Pseudomonadota bacterium]
MGNINTEYFIDNLIDFCISKKKKFIFISGNGASGKTELAKSIYHRASKLGNINIINMDEFVVNTKLRKNSIASWRDHNNKIRTGRCSTSFEESYFVQNVKAIIYNLEKGNDYYHWPKKAKSNKECILLKADAILQHKPKMRHYLIIFSGIKSAKFYLQCISISKKINIIFCSLKITNY